MGEENKGMNVGEDINLGWGRRRNGRWRRSCKGRSGCAKKKKKEFIMVGGKEVVVGYQ